MGDAARVLGRWSSPAAAAESLKFLSTTNPEREPNYQYSRDFGSQFEGCGLVASHPAASLPPLFPTMCHSLARPLKLLDLGCFRLGMGLPLARLHVKYLGGELQLGGLAGVGVRACLTFDATGERSDAMHDATWAQRWTRVPDPAL